MRLFRRALALIGLPTLSAVASGAQPPFEHQMWSAGHVVLAQCVGNDEPTRYRLIDLLRGDPKQLRYRASDTLDVDDATWRLLGKHPAIGQNVLLALTGPRARTPAHTALELYPLKPDGSFVHAAGDAGVQRQLSLRLVSQILQQPPFETRSCARTIRSQDYLLCIEVLHAGTRSEGRIGRLYQHGVEVAGDREGQLIEFDHDKGLRLVYRGARRPHLWSTSGWDLAGPASP